MPPIPQTTFHHWRIEIDPDATRIAYAELNAPDPACCNACATFREAIRRNLLPGELTTLLSAAGADPEKVQEVWGAPDSGFLNGWWIVVGRMLDAEWDGRGEGSYVEPVPGMRCWITGTPSMRPPLGLEGQPLLQVEFEWHDQRLLPELESHAWPNSR